MSPDIRVLEGTEEEARELFEEMRRGGREIDEPTYPGVLVELPGEGE